MIQLLRERLFTELRGKLSRTPDPRKLAVLKTDWEFPGTVSFYVFEPGAADPIVHVTFVRERADNRILEHEFATLQQLGQKLAGTNLESGLPAPLALLDLNGTAALATTVLRGKPMHDFVGERLQKRDVATARLAATAAVQWVLTLQQSLPAGRVVLPAVAPRQMVHDAAAAIGLPTREWSDITANLPPDLEEMSLPGVGSHGNLSLRNLVWDGHRIGLLAWSGFHSTAPALYDLFTLAHSFDEYAGSAAPVREVVDQAYETRCQQLELQPVKAWKIVLAAALRRLQDAAATGNLNAARQATRVVRILVANSGPSWARTAKNNSGVAVAGSVESK